MESQNSLADLCMKREHNYYSQTLLGRENNKTSWFLFTDFFKKYHIKQ